MAQVARQNDMHSHGGYIVNGSPDTFANGLPVARQGDMAMCSQHGMVQIITASSTVFANGHPVARVGDMLSCGAQIITGSPDTYAGN
jgi:uncharacterized Zn-binding protein involved in type VI secretion